MHTFEWTNEDPHPFPEDISQPGDVVYIHHNGDYSGEAIISVPAEFAKRMIDSYSSEPPYDGTNQGRMEFKLPAKLLAAFSKEATISGAIAALENL
jgi:hypothetical protein